jgi:hypothetical protein
MIMNENKQRQAQNQEITPDGRQTMEENMRKDIGFMFFCEIENEAVRLQM